MNRRNPQATSRARALGALGAVALLALLALAALFLATMLADRRTTSSAPSARPSTAVGVGRSEQAVPTLHGFHQQPSMRARNAAFGVLAVALALGAFACRRLRGARPGRPRALRIAGLPSGRAPPRHRIA